MRVLIFLLAITLVTPALALFLLRFPIL